MILRDFILILSMSLIASQLNAAEANSPPPPLKEVYQKSIKQQEYLQQLRWQLEAFKIKADQYKTKADMARALEEALRTGLVDSDGNIAKEGVSTGGALPTLVSLQGGWAYFSTPNGTLRAGIGTVLPGGYRLKAFRQRQVVLEQNGNEYVVKINWTRAKKSKQDILQQTLGGAESGTEVGLPEFTPPGVMIKPHAHTETPETTVKE